jgi:hypothetical protein
VSVGLFWLDRKTIDLRPRAEKNPFPYLERSGSISRIRSPMSEDRSAVPELHYYFGVDIENDWNIMESV